MKKFIKILSVALISLFAILIVTVSVALYLVFTPERLTPIVRKQADKFFTCQTGIGEVELTFFSTFPDFGVKISQFTLINPGMDPRFDTLVKVNKLVGAVDASAWWKRKELILKGLELSGGSVSLFADSLGNTNYDIFPVDTTITPVKGSESSPGTIDIRNIVLEDVNLHYNDLSLKLNTVIRDLSASISATINHDEISSCIKMKRAVISLEYNGEKYLQQATVRLDIPVDVIPSRQLLMFRNARASVNDLEFILDGSVENDTANRKIITGINYKFSSWPVEKLLALVPLSLTSYISGIKAEGLLSSDGSVKGFMTDSLMPVMDVHVLLRDGELDYPGFPLHLHDVEGEINLFTDMKTDSISFVKILSLNAKTPLSSISVAGLVKHLFTDIYCDLNTTAGLTLDEFNPMIPESMKLSLKGKAAGKIRSAFSIPQLEKMQLEKMKLSGSLLLSDFNCAYDSITIDTDRSKIDFTLPNYKSFSTHTQFATAKIMADNITAGKPGIYNSSLQKASVTFETSDPRDTTRIPDFICSFTMDSLSAYMDSLSIAVAKPVGKVSLSQVSERPGEPRIMLSYKSDDIKSGFGQSSFTADAISFDTDLIYDNSQKELFLQWLVKGFVDMNHGTLKLAALSHPIEIPSLKMNFDPEKFIIEESKIQVDRSDFQLTGYLNNIISYFKGDSILRGKFNFVSNTTDIAQLMALTNGIGYEDSTATEKSEIQETDSTYAGPYMVPRKIDLLLDANIKMASMEADTATNIKGIVRVNDGILVLDGLTFETPAARMQLTAMYRTPRKNHLFLGIDYHMLDIEISELLTMIPDIDTLMPMLRSFSGKGEFHIAVESYLDSLYNLKKSTLRGASSIKGTNLVLMDGETFSEIAKTLRFNKKTENKVDSLSAEFTIFRNEIDIYPFLIVLDKYKAVVAGRHNFDLTYDYHISVVDSPLPLKLGVDVKGDAENLSYKLARCRYAEFYRPTSRGVVENKQLELRKLIRETLTQKVKQ